MDQSERRERSLTEKGQAHFAELKQSLRAKVQKSCQVVESYFVDLSSLPTEESELVELEQNLQLAYKRYKSDSDHFLDFLSRSATEESKIELESSFLEFSYVQKQVLIMFDALNVAISQAIENGQVKSGQGGSLHSSLKSGQRGSRHSSEKSGQGGSTQKLIKSAQGGSRHSSVKSGLGGPHHEASARFGKSSGSHHSARSQESNTSSLVARIKAKAEAAKAKLMIADQEAILKKQRNNLNVELDLLEQKKEVAAAEAEANCLERELSARYEGSSSESELDLPSDTENPAERTKRYVDSIHRLPDPALEKTKLSPHAAPFLPAPTGFEPIVDTKPIDNAAKNNTLCSDSTFGIANYLLKRDLFFTKFRHFDDRPEHYSVWKAEFSNLIKDLRCTPLEEIGLLTSYLGQESSKQALSIRSSCATDSALALRKIWSRLDERYGSAELVESALKAKLSSFPRITDNKKLYELHDILSEIESVKQQPQYAELFAYFDSSLGIKPIVQKLSTSLQEKWINRAVRYKEQNKVLFPPFTEFVRFVGDMSRIKNDPGFNFTYESGVGNKPKGLDRQRPIGVRAAKTAVSENSAVGDKPNISMNVKCIIHKNATHSTSDCRVLRTKPLSERRSFLKQNKLCFRCCDSSHMKNKCQTPIKCKLCNSKSHCTALHDDSEINVSPIDKPSSRPHDKHGGEFSGQSASLETPAASSLCTEICGVGFSGKSCAKIIPVTVYPKGNYTKSVRTYAMLDDQSNKTLARKELFDSLGVSSDPIEYSLTSCSGQVVAYGRTVSGLVVESVNGQTQLDLPTLLECDDIPDNQLEVPTPNIARHYAHLQDITECIEPYDDSRKILLLIGRDLPEAHHMIDQRLGPPRAPFAQKFALGWTIIGDVCLSGQHIPNVVSVHKTFVTPNGRRSVLEPCPQTVKVREYAAVNVNNQFVSSHERDLSSLNLFKRTVDDNKVGLSVEDKQFLDIMDEQMLMNTDGKWTAPLPFRSPRIALPNNYSQALRRAKALDASLRKDPIKKEHFLAFMQKLFDNNHAEIAPPLHNEECWYLPLFGVYHPKKPQQIRGVFDSSATYDGVSLNDTLLSGPNLTNNLLGVLLRFRKENVAVIADIQQMFYCFEVREDHRNYLRFLWHRDNNFENELVDYRMKVHVFGNSPSPAVASYGLLKSGAIAEETYGVEVRRFIYNNFYVDDGLLSVSTSKEAVDILKGTQMALKKIGGLRLHKIASNDEIVMRAFKSDDLAKDLVDLDLAKDKPMQRSLGLNWNLDTDTFEFDISPDEKPISRRGILSTINSLYHPLGFLSPFTILGKLILRKVVSSTFDWDDPLPEQLVDEWKIWYTSLRGVRSVSVPRAYVRNLNTAMRKELWTYSDASQQAIAAVSYLRVLYEDGSSSTGFVLGKAKVAPPSGHTIPRLELCAAVLAVEVAQLATDQMQIKLDDVKYFTDSRVVLGYICNERKRFLVYVANRVAQIRNVTKPLQWSYVPSEDNPADIGTRGLVASELQNSSWLVGPTKPLQEALCAESSAYPLVDPDQDKEIHCTTMKTTVDVKPHLGTHRFQRFSKWSTLVNAITFLRRYISLRHRKNADQTYQDSVSSYQDSEKFIVRCVQQEQYSLELDCMHGSKPLPRNSSIASLNPSLDQDGILRVGGRLRRMDCDRQFKNPIIIPGNCHIATLLVRMCHEKVKHQGRHFTEGKVRSSGFWITHCKRLVSSILYKCVICRKLRRPLEEQKMSDLPEDRLTSGVAPFSAVGVDMFGPWEVVTRRTRGGVANSKRWAALFTCLATRAVHIEVVEEMSSSSFVNALRRFIAIRGKVREFRSDRGTNFVGALDHLQIDSIKIEDEPVKDFLHNNGTVWIFNPPHSSHMGGVWERMIGVTRRILDSMLLENRSALTHEVLTTFLVEASSIINSRPLISVSTDPESPFILTPSILLTQKLEDVDYNVTVDMMNPKDLLRTHWKRVQHLSAVFWKRWRNEYLHSLQPRKKWTQTKENLSTGDIVLLRDKQMNRLDWPMGVVVRCFPSDDNLVRKVEIRVVSNGKSIVYVRPVSELVRLLSPELAKSVSLSPSTEEKSA